jgi:hypothetical protein
MQEKSVSYILKHTLANRELLSKAARKEEILANLKCSAKVPSFPVSQTHSKKDPSMKCQGMSFKKVLSIIYLRR